MILTVGEVSHFMTKSALNYTHLSYKLCRSVTVTKDSRGYADSTQMESEIMLMFSILDSCGDVEDFGRSWSGRLLWPDNL